MKETNENTLHISEKLEKRLEALNQVRPALLDTVIAQEEVMKKHDPERGDSWETCPLQVLWEHLDEEVFELLSLRHLNISAKWVSKEALDVANMAMMIYHRSLLEEAKQQEAVSNA